MYAALDYTSPPASTRPHRTSLLLLLGLMVIVATVWFARSTSDAVDQPGVAKRRRPKTSRTESSCRGYSLKQKGKDCEINGGRGWHYVTVSCSGRTVSTLYRGKKTKIKKCGACTPCSVYQARASNRHMQTRVRCNC
eukprot:NODE_6296_length_551_cov_23.202830_g6131_i0.p2 GENE.NODE_6296_length_551_cov_23.202830_g6131_i0~~NODE_6296_length_551_cov_23.202830_g6131_i0.p2  ORF type:complete len:156 (+),score=28.74 NODE_6296_length_551_cov_23.202830_g6131_i0:59-469(+)